MNKILEFVFSADSGCSGGAGDNLYYHGCGGLLAEEEQTGSKGTVTHPSDTG